MTMAALVAIVAATLVSEDLTAVGVGLALREGSLPFGPALIACFTGIYLGDIALWAAGRFGGRRVLGWRVVSRLPMTALHRLGRWIDQHPGLAIIGSRCVPGTRVALYVAAGVWGERPWRFFAWMFVAVAVWTPLLVIGAMLVGDGIGALVDVDPLSRWLLQGLSAGSCVALLWLARLIASSDGRSRIALTFARLGHWEFWPSWAIYAPVVAWIAWLALRYRSLTIYTAVNPAIDHSGFVGESKSAILATLPQTWVMPWAVIETGTVDARLEAIRSMLMVRGWTFPLVAKPDVGQRGVGVQWLHSVEDAERYLTAITGRLILQVPHNGPYEVGVFYVRMPGAASGRLISITDKRFPVLVGDGRSTVEELILTHRRFRLQASVFLTRHASDRARVLGAGERFAIGQIGNHSKGTRFLDGRHLWTPALEARIDEIAQAAGGVYFGRFDVRYRSVEGFKAGEDLAILELNGVTSEAAHIYGGSLWLAWWTLMRQWSLAFEIGAANRARGHQPTSIRRLLTLILQFRLT